MIINNIICDNDKTIKKLKIYTTKDLKIILILINLNKY